jgi:CRP-like cAMP-binding protein
MNYCRIKPESFDIKKILPPEDIDKMRFESFCEGSILYHQDNIKLLIFKKGKAKVVFYDDGDAFTLYYLVKNNIFVLEENSVVEFLENSEVYVLNARVFSKLFKNVEFANLILASMVKSLEIERKIIKNLVFNDCKRRVVSFLVDVALSTGVKEDDGILIDLTMSISEFADFIASKRQTISSVLNEFIKDGILCKLNSTKYIVKDINSLKKYLSQ